MWTWWCIIWSENGFRNIQMSFLKHITRPWFWVFVAVSKPKGPERLFYILRKQTVCNDRRKQSIIFGSLQGSIYAVGGQKPSSSPTVANIAFSRTWRERPAHVNRKGIVKMFRRGVIRVVPQLYESWNPMWFVCELSIAQRENIRRCRSDERSIALLYFIHTDVCGPIDTASLGSSVFYHSQWRSFSLVYHFFNEKEVQGKRFAFYTTRR